MKLFSTLLIGLLPLTTLAVDFGPFTLTGFAKVEASHASNQCSNCQLIANEDRHRPWADALAQGDWARVEQLAREACQLKLR